MRITITRDGRRLTQDNQRYKPWHRLRHDGELDEIILQPGSYVSGQEIKDKWVHDYYDPPPEKPLREIQHNTLFWYAPGEYKLYKPTHPLQAEIAGIYLKGVIPQEAQDEALKGLQQMDWDHHPPERRPETLTAIDRQKGLISPGEYTYGYTFFSGILEKASRRIEPQVKHLEPLLKEMDACFARTLPVYHRQLSTRKTSVESDLGVALQCRSRIETAA